MTETGTTPPKSHPEYFGDYIPFLSPANIQNNKIISITQGLSKTGLQYGRVVEPGTILQVCIGGSIGKCAITNKVVTFNQQINSITPIFCDITYINSILQSENFRLQIVDSSTGTATPIINRTNWENLLIPIPPIEEQKRLTHIIEALTPFILSFENLADNLNLLNTSIKSKLTKSILQEAIQGKLIPQIESEGTAEELLKEIRSEKKQLVKEGKLKKSALANESRIFRGEDNKYYEQIGDSVSEMEIEHIYPESWRLLRLKDLCSLTDGEKREGSYICLDAKYLRGKSTGEYLSKGNYVHKGDDIILVDGENSGEVFTVPIDGYMGSTFKQLWISSALNKHYVLMFILFHKEKLRNSKKGAAIPHLNKDIFNNLIIGIPPLAEQNRIVGQVKDLTQLLK